jgi:hypothetical protein
MRTLALLFTISTLFSFTSPSRIKPVFAKAEYVYICNSTTAYAYHSIKDCSGLNRCTHEILKITKDEAVDKYGRKPCKVCYQLIGTTSHLDLNK